MIINDIGIDWDMVMKVLSEKERVRPDSSEIIKAAVCESIEKARGLCHPQALVIEKKITAIDPGSIQLDGSSKLSGRALASYLTGADHVYLFLVTIGSDPENEASRLMNIGETLSGYMLDRTASITVECLAENLENRLRKGCEDKGRSISMRLSPGYCDWPVEEQVKLDTILNYSKIGVSLTESCMMIPRKSISGLMGIGPKGHFIKARSQCVICNKKDCDYHRT